MLELWFWNISEHEALLTSDLEVPILIPEAVMLSEAFRVFCLLFQGKANTHNITEENFYLLEEIFCLTVISMLHFFI